MSLPRYAVPAVVVALLAVLLCRLQYGVNLRDESFYLTMPYGFTSGLVPFRDEWRVHQTAGVLLVPLVALHRLLFGSFAIVLTARLWYFLGALLVGFCVYRLLRRDYGRDTALFAALFPVLSVPFSLFAWSYNSLAAIFLLVTLLFAWAGRENPRPLYWSGFFAALTAWVYPPLLIVVALLTGMVLWHRRSVRFFAGAATAAAPLLLVLVAVGWDSVQRCLHFTTALTGQGITLDRFLLLFPSFLQTLGPRREVWPTIAAFVACLLFRRRWLAIAAFLLLGVTLTYGNELGHIASLGLNIRLALLAWLFYPAITRPETRALYLWVGLPSVVAGGVCAMASTNYHINGGVGMLPGAMVFLIAFGDIARRTGTVVSSLFIFAFLTWHHWGSYQPLYRERDIGELTARVTSGPYAGLRTTPTMASYLKRLEPQLVALSSRASRVAYYFEPVGYLFTSLPPAVPTTWIDGVEPLQRYIIEWFARNDDGRSAFVWLKSTPDSDSWGKPPVPDDGLTLQWILANRARVYDSDEIAVFQGPLLRGDRRFPPGSLPARYEAGSTPAASGTDGSREDSPSARTRRVARKPASRGD